MRLHKAVKSSEQMLGRSWIFSLQDIHLPSEILIDLLNRLRSIFRRANLFGELSEIEQSMMGKD